MNKNPHKFGKIIIANSSLNKFYIDGCTKCGITFDQLFELLEYDYNLGHCKLFFKGEDVGDIKKETILKIFNKLYPCKFSEEEALVKDIIE